MNEFFILKGSNVELEGAPETISVLPLGHVVSSKGEFDFDEDDETEEYGDYEDADSASDPDEQENEE